MTTFSSRQRKDIWSSLTKEKLDLLVIGGGITGAGIALDAATRGLNTGVVEMQDFAAGTSSRSTKLVHGGLRYLKQFEVKLVAEVGKEREIVYENGPHVTTPEWMMLPFHKGGTFGPFSTNIGLRVYDFLAGVKKSERRKMLNVEEALTKEPLIKKENLKGAGYYVEYKTDDARLTIEVMKKAVQKGAHAINYAKVIDFIYSDQGQLAGVVVEDQLTNETKQIYAKKIVNAGGPWVDELREIDGSKQGKHLHLSKGIHLVFSKKDFPLQQAVYFDVPDGRMIFAIPRENKTYVGTTDTFYDGAIEHPTVTEADRDYIINAVNDMFPSLQINAEHVESSWAGIRPLIAEEGKKPGEISRKDEIFISNSGLISMAGGKLTGYRKMAEQAVDKVVAMLKQEEGILYSESTTKHLPIAGGEVGGSKGFSTYVRKKSKEGIALGLDERTTLRLIERYGANVERVFQLYQDLQEEAKKEQMDTVVLAELEYGLQYELVYKPVDFFIRRTGALFFEINWVKEHQEAVMNYMKKALNWEEEEAASYQSELDREIYEATRPTETVYE
ncbi:glycerol-3-phosphate dehydrogenase/oxidase [Virgibacillus sp. MG-45]|uniref:glycerol-3-phosphate dehydrogenase/oxidase n=1 Tax=Virgibacillus sp. MG-45 TaxID=3102791 RepID=UPI002ED9CAAF